MTNSTLFNQLAQMQRTAMEITRKMHIKYPELTQVTAPFDAEVEEALADDSTSQDLPF